MASLPSVVFGNSIKLESEFRKHTTNTFLPLDKRNYNTPFHLDKAFDPMSLDYREALSVIKQGSSLEPSVYLSLLQGYIHKNSILHVESLHGHIIKTGVVQNLYLMTYLVNAYGKCGSMEYARKVFDNLSMRNVVTWTSLMSGYAHNGLPKLAIRVFREMLEVGGYPTNYTLGVVLNACYLSSALKLGKQIHGYIVKYQIEHDTSVGNALCNMYSKGGSLNSAVKALRRIRERNVISWTSAISACGENDDPARGLGLFVEMLSEGVEANEFALSTVLSLCSTMRAIDVGHQIHSLTIKLGFKSNVPVTNTIMYLYLKCGWLSEANKLFDGMEKISLLTWNSLIAGHSRMMDFAEDSLSSHRYGIEALNIFLRLNRSNMKPDLYTLSSVLTVCSSLVALEQGEQVHAHAIKTGFLSDVVVGTALVNMYNKCGSIERASKAFVEMPKRTMISWTSMITAFAQHGRSQQALQVFQDMRLAGVRPNVVTFVGVLSACSHAGLVDEALSSFEMMKNEYKITPVMDHFSCLIDMFVRMGKMDEAFDFIKKMEFEPNEFIWSLLIAGCRSHGNLELGFYAAEQLLNLNPKNPENYVLLLNMYVSAGRWKDVSRVRKMMRDEKVAKLKDWSWISIREKIYSFKPDDRSCSFHGDLEKLLGDLVEKARSLGYESQDSVDLSEEKDEDANSATIVHHSEKLAIAFGLLNSPNGAAIRVIKSISMCTDCHSLLKFVSVITAREIIVRDSRRLHKFVNGQCSCGNFGSLL